MAAITPIVRLLDADSEMHDGLDPRAIQVARQKLVAEIAVLAPGGVEANALGDAQLLLILTGFVVRSVRVLDRIALNVLGSGDVMLLDPSDDAVVSVRSEVRFGALGEAHVAVLGRSFLRAAAGYPHLDEWLVRKLARQQADLAFQLAVAQIPQLDQRIMALLWRLADRWGVQTVAGAVVPIPLTHKHLAALASVRRTSATKVLGQLAFEERLQPAAGGGWLLPGDPPGQGGDVGLPTRDGRRLTFA